MNDFSYVENMVLTHHNWFTAHEYTSSFIQRKLKCHFFARQSLVNSGKDVNLQANYTIKNLSHIASIQIYLVFQISLLVFV